jgi:hypothetical protein
MSMSSWRAEGKSKNKCKGKPRLLEQKKKALKAMARELKSRGN